MSDAQGPQPKRDQVGKIMTSFLMAEWLIDDLLSNNNPYMPYLLYTKQSLFYPDVTGIYLDTLALSLAHPGSSMPYMDITIGAEPSDRRRLTTQLYDN